MLHDFLFANRAAIIARTRAKVASRVAPCATPEELESGIPLFLDQLVETLRSPNRDNDAIAESATQHGLDLMKRGFTVGQVVHDYGDLCQAVTELAGEMNAPIAAEEFHTFNGCLDDAIAAAVSEHGRTREQAITAAGTERSGSLAHELRNALGAAMLSFQSLKAGNVGIGGSTSALLARSLRRLSVLIDSSIARVRLESSTLAIERVSMHEFIEEIEVGATMEAAREAWPFSYRRCSPVSTSQSTVSFSQGRSSTYCKCLQVHARPRSSFAEHVLDEGSRFHQG